MLKPAYKLTFGREAGVSSGLQGTVSNVAAGVLGDGGQIVDTTDEPQASIIVDLTYVWTWTMTLKPWPAHHRRAAGR